MDPRDKQTDIIKNPAENPPTDKQNIITTRVEALDEIDEKDVQSGSANDQEEGN